MNEESRAHELGREHGRNVGSWVIDGNTTESTARRILAGIEDCDSEIMDMIPSPLSGEWSGDPTPQSVLAQLGITDPDEQDNALNEYESGFTQGWEGEVSRAARAITGGGNES